MFFVALVAASWSEAVDKGEQAFQENCSLCHPLDRPRAKHLTRDEWQQTIEKIVVRAVAQELTHLQTLKK